MSMSIKASPDGTTGEILLNGTTELIVSNNKLELADGKDFFNQGNIVGTVSQSGGVPTGAVVERGSNANGVYVRFADGTQICISATILDVPCNIASGALFTGNDTYTWTLPAAFINTAYRVTTGTVGNVATHWTTGRAGTTSAAIVGAWATASFSTRPVGAIAIGHWF